MLCLRTVKCQNSSTSNNSVKHKYSLVLLGPIERIVSNSTALGQSGPGSDGNEKVIRIPQSSSITGTSASYCSVSYQEHSFGVFTSLQGSSRCIPQPQPTRQDHVECTAGYSMNWPFRQRSNNHPSSVMASFLSFENSFGCLVGWLVAFMAYQHL